MLFRESSLLASTGVSIPRMMKRQRAGINERYESFFTFGTRTSIIRVATTISTNESEDLKLMSRYCLSENSFARTKSGSDISDMNPPSAVRSTGMIEICRSSIERKRTASVIGMNIRFDMGERGDMYPKKKNEGMRDANTAEIEMNTDDKTKDIADDTCG